MRKKLNFIFKNKKINNFFLYLLAFLIFIFCVYLLIPKFFNYTPNLIQKSLNKNSNINIKNISNISYKFFPSPRLRLSGSSLVVGDNILKVEGSKVEIILNPLSIINYRTIDYNKFLIREGTIIVEIKKINQIFNYIKNNKKKINFDKNTIILFQKNKKLFEIKNSKINVNSKNNRQKLSVDGLLLNHNVSFHLKNNLENKTNIVLEIPELDISTKILVENNNNFQTFESKVNLVILNNFLRFNLIKKKIFLLNQGYIRNNLINLSFQGEMALKPHLFFNLNVKPSVVNVEKLFSLIQKKYFLESPPQIEQVKKLNGFINFDSIFEGNIIFENREILFKNFKTDKNNPIYFDGKISELGNKGKIDFNLKKKIVHKKNSKELKISGIISPFTSKAKFKEILIDKEILTEKKTRSYEEIFNKQVINGTLSNIFNKKIINSFFKKFVN